MIRLKYKGKKSARGYIPRGGLGRSTSDVAKEIFGGEVQGKKASQIEERFAKALDKKGIPYQFRVAVGASRNMPGWKELDFLVEKSGTYFAVEIDSAFTHRDKGSSDVLHDAIVLKELAGLPMYPEVLHFDMERDLVTQEETDKTVERNIL
jgi:hypothetical protein